MMTEVDQASIWIRGCTEWIENHAIHGWWEPYYVNFMFEPLPGAPSAIVAQMHRSIIKFYGRFCTEFTRNPRADSEQDRLPRLWLFPDKPTLKRGSKVSVHDVTFNDDGLHFNGPMLLQRFSRFRRCPIQYFEQKQSTYSRHGIRRIHVKAMTNMKGLADYAAKTIKGGRADPDEILILPRAASELLTSATFLSPSEKVIKDLEAATNISPETVKNLQLAT